MNKKFLSILLLSTAALVSGIAHADAQTAPAKQLKVGVVSATDIMMGTDAGKEANSFIEKEREKSMKTLQTRAQAIEKKQKELEAKASTMSAESQRKLNLEIANLRQELELDNKKFMQELQLAAQTEMEKLGQEFDKAVQQVAKQSKADLIFEKESGRIIFAAEGLNITESVKVAMNAEHKTTQLASAAKAPAKATA